MNVGLDIGGTKTEALVISPDGAIIEQLRIPTGYGAAAVIDTAMEAIRELAARLEISPAEFTSIGIGIPGVVDATTGTVSHAVNLGLSGLPLGAELASRLGVPVRVENDVNAAALGVFHSLGDPGIHSMAYLNLGTGLAAGLVLEGRLWRGSRGTAGEIGHIPVDPFGPLCACGQHGCLELSASGSAIARLWPGDYERPVEALFAAADAGDESAIAVRSTVVSNIAAAVRVLVLTIDVDVVVIGGGMSSLGAPLLTRVQATLDEWSRESPFLGSLDLSSRVRALRTGQPIAAVGAALVGATQVAAGVPVSPSAPLSPGAALFPGAAAHG